ncbi:hypothetical protein BC937DRAFT_93478, partial [Endogone sp. FLAS-F59071]
MGSKQSKPTGSSAASIYLQNRKFEKNSSGTPAFIPSDSLEFDRYHNQSFLIKEAFEGNFLPGVKLHQEHGYKLLDVNCGPATWLFDVATEHPAIDCVGVAVSKETFPTSVKPPNLSFQVANVLQGLPFAEETFDLVQLRQQVTVFQTKDWLRVIKEVVRVTKRGGYVQLIEPNVRFLTTDNEANDFMTSLHDMLVRAGADPDIYPKIPGYLAAADVHILTQKEVSIPIGWKNKLGELMLANITQSLISAAPAAAPALKLDIETYVKMAEDTAYRLQASKASVIWHGFLGKK